MTEKMRMISETEYEFYKKMLYAVQDFYNWAKEEDKEEPRGFTQWAYESVSNETAEAVEFAFENDLVED